MDLGAATHTGYVRPENEDGFFASPELAVFAVADGMGGHEHGEVASHLALETITRYAESLATAQPTELPGQLHRAIQEANASIITEAVSQDARNRMGTTVVVGTVHGDRLYFAHIGDSRLYLLRGEIFTQLTRDHSLVQAMVDRGDITPEEAAIHPLRHQITRVVGGDDYISPEIASQALESGDLIMLCTDGLSGVIEQETMRGVLQGDGTCQQKAETLVQAALKAGGPDNVTVVVGMYERPHPLPETAPPHHLHLSFLHTIGIILLFLLASVLVFAGWSYTHPQYFIGVDGQRNVSLYKHWVGLPMLGTVRLPNPHGISIPLIDVKPYLDEYGDVDQGIPVKEEAAPTMVQKLLDDTGNGLLEQANKAIKHKDFVDARALVARAKALGVEPGLVKQIEQIIAKTESIPPHTR